MKNFLKTLIAPTLVALLVAGVANGAVYQWSHTAGSNATADASINWSEGMSPSSVNDSARAMMARVADWRDDTSGVLITTGTATAYALTTYQGFPNPPTDGQLVAFSPHATNGAAATLAADGGTARAIQISPGVAAPAGTLVAGTPYAAVYKTSATAWILKGYYSSATHVPLGAVLDYTGTTAPNSNFVLANGQCISQTTYAAYFSLVGSAFGACGAGLFAVPDLSNRVVAGTQMGGTARITVAGGNFDGNTIGTAGGTQNHTLSTEQIPAITPAGTISTVTPTGTVSISSVTGDVSTTVFSAGGGSAVATPSPTGSILGALNPGVGVYSVNATATSGFSFTGGTASFSGSGTTPTFTGTSFGGGTSHPIVQPTMVLTKIVRVL